MRKLLLTVIIILLATPAFAEGSLALEYLTYDQIATIYGGSGTAYDRISAYYALIYSPG